MSRFDERFEGYLDRRRVSQNLRALVAVTPQGPARLTRSGRPMVNFSSNNYLGLSHHPAVIARSREYTERFGAGSGASRLVCGTLELHEEVERKLAKLKGTEAALIFGSGFQANSSLLPALFDRQVVGQQRLVFTDRLIHASLHQGCAAAGVREIRFRHNDVRHLAELLDKYHEREAARFIITESVFSMDGDQIDLGRVIDLAEAHNAFLFVDEAHATGVLGPKGMGLSGYYPGRVDLALGTFSKALGSFGGFITCSQVLRDYMVNRCAGFIYSTALPPSALGAVDAALDLVPEMEAERRRLHHNADRVRNAFQQAGIDTLASTTQIVPAVVGSEQRALSASRKLEDQGILGIAIRPPTVPHDTSRIRFGISAAHDDEDIGRLLDAVPLLL